jgi:hypothetical protein
MSDGPHRSLPMSLGWRRVAAERGYNSAFAPDEISKALIPALEQACRDEMSTEFLGRVCALYRHQDASLFKEHPGSQLEALRSAAGCGIGRTVLDNVIQISASGDVGLDALANAMTAALIDRAARAARQIEEHCCRKSPEPRAHNTRARIEQAIGATPIEALARQILKLDARRPARPPLKQHGLDDGVSLDGCN